MPQEVRNKVVARLKKILSPFGLEVAECGGKYDELRQKISSYDGGWDDSSYNSKPSRLIIHLEFESDELLASIEAKMRSGAFAYANTAEHRSVGGLIVRVLPVIKRGPTDYFPYPQWEWLLWFVFLPQLPSGHSGSIFEFLNPRDGHFRYGGRDQRYIAAGLVTLCKGDDLLALPNRDQPILYSHATNAIRTMLNVDPTLPGSPKEGQANA